MNIQPINYSPREQEQNVTNKNNDLASTGSLKKDMEESFIKAIQKRDISTFIGHHSH